MESFYRPEYDRDDSKGREFGVRTADIKICDVIGEEKISGCCQKPGRTAPEGGCEGEHGEPGAEIDQKGGCVLGDHDIFCDKGQQAGEVLKEGLIKIEDRVSVSPDHIRSPSREDLAFEPCFLYAGDPDEVQERVVSFRHLPIEKRPPDDNREGQDAQCPKKKRENLGLDIFYCLGVQSIKVLHIFVSGAI